MHLCFAIPWGASWKPLWYVFPYDLNIHLTFIVSLFMIFRLCYFSCYNMVAKFYCQDYVSYAHVLSTLISTLNALPSWSRLWWCMSPQKLFFCYHLPTRGRAGVKLGMFDTSQTYLSFLMLHACLYTICFVFCYTSWRFYVFSRTNLLTRCHSASSLFSDVFVFQKSYIGNILGIGRNKSQTSYFSRRVTKSEDETEGGQRPSSP
jgi:hypothetical protein